MKQYLGFDIGGTSIKCILIDQKRTILYQDSIPTQEMEDPLHTLSVLTSRAKTQIATAKEQLCGVGIGCTGPIDNETGVIHNPFTLPGYEGINIRTLMEKEFCVPVTIDNDANTAHVGEASRLTPAILNTIMITFGTGIGVSIRLGGELFRLPSAFHPEIGHISVGVDSLTSCYCGKSRCFEHVMSGTAINRYAMETYARTPEEVLQNPESKDSQAFVGRMISATTEAIITLSILFRPEIVFIGGGMQEFIRRYVMAPVQDRLDSLLPVYGKTTLQETLMGPLGGCYGAAIQAIAQVG